MAKCEATHSTTHHQDDAGWLVVGSRSEWLYCSTSESINRTEEIITNFMDVISGLHLRTLILST